ncbi:hypothetical protein A2X44_02415 [candidate division CPR3 bacterium GWF2_35_18]|uniref:Peptidase M23 domain-containing protein n=1 Tax=candidate division CPR3 bacterium GW2011_GWF2_35_18 TaxID=1618350 RepID=A0A0G0C1R7_UNCC3|nr:MAG: hypothetical protein UR67_C0002G0166 [candidate division CPR3 bacterium GW2011_GWF2_35_18]KKP85052.1 MAG: hypothetical protein UR87_C0061G0009 [candidate division CPR3 bacterium GW2011_GWE2_35_7]OGB62849.1 MAG: hypothetical protein A2X44_02415 [candidate division CPR3 bacterium GWF2_35_18]OGB65430.1 MAG: hypothetical protein A2250_00630 [candidate division CPR3 bacterium RIFOXYA2_FULL_35_13]OGB77082.1 MAG: hypothetical protein A2476_02820 [candidate division CPR3 bacterium RIFOXYC2_FULL
MKKIKISLFLIIFVSILFSKNALQAETIENISENDFKFEVIYRIENILPEELTKEVENKLQHWSLKAPQNNKFFITSIDIKKNNWGVLSATTLDLDQIKNAQDYLDSTNTFLVLVVLINNEWKVSYPSDNELQEILNNIPDSELDPSLKDILFINNPIIPSSKILLMTDQLYSNYKFPWSYINDWKWTGSYPTAGWHDPSNNSLDFQTYDAEVPTAGQSALAASNGVIAYKCSDFIRVTVTVGGQNEEWQLAHFNATGLSSLQNITQGQTLGSVLTDPSNPPPGGCGYGSGAHLHMNFPTKPFIIDNIEYTQDDIHSGEALHSTNGCVPPSSENWIITTDCTLTGSHTAPANVTVQNNSLLTIESNANLNIDFINYKLEVIHNSGVLIKNGGKIE